MNLHIPVPLKSKKTKLFVIAGILLLIIATLSSFPNKQKVLVTATPTIWKIMPLGDSLTEGNYPSQIHSYRGYLRAKLIANGHTNINFVGDRFKQAHGDSSPLDFNHAGHGGYTIGPDTQKWCETCETTGIYEHIEQWLNVSDPDIILLLIGINDLVSKDSHPPNYAQTAPNRLENLVQKIQHLRPNAKIIISSLLKMRLATSWPKYDAINTRAAQIGNANAFDNLFFVDLNAIDLAYGDFKDNVHLKESGARKIADGWYDALVPFFGGTLPPITPTAGTPLEPTASIGASATPAPPSSPMTCIGICYTSNTNCFDQKCKPKLCTTLTPQQTVSMCGWPTDLKAYRCCSSTLPVSTPTISPTSPHPSTPIPTPVSSSSLSCTGGCYSNSESCKWNCSPNHDEPCTTLDQADVAQQGCWPGAYRCCQ